MDGHVNRKSQEVTGEEGIFQKEEPDRNCVVVGECLPAAKVLLNVTILANCQTHVLVF